MQKDNKMMNLVTQVRGEGLLGLFQEVRQAAKMKSQTEEIQQAQESDKKFKTMKTFDPGKEEVPVFFRQQLPRGIKERESSHRLVPRPCQSVQQGLYVISKNV